MKRIRRELVTMMAVFAVLTLSGPLWDAAAEGTAKGESSDEKGQQGVGLESGSQSSNVIMGGPDIVVGTITRIQGEQYAIQGDRGQKISLRVTKDTNKICAEGQGTKFSTGQESAREHHEIPPTPFMEQQTDKRGGEAISEQEMMKQLGESGTEKEMGALSKDPSKMKMSWARLTPRRKRMSPKGPALSSAGRTVNSKRAITSGSRRQIWGPRPPYDNLRGGTPSSEAKRASHGQELSSSRKRN